jgi:Holliday junction resolvasome RuvABC endonuclease subunit
MIVLAFDPGLRNLAWCLMDNGVVRDIDRADIFTGGTIQQCDAFNSISSFCDRMASAFAMADLVVIERQFIDNKIRLSGCLSVVQTVLQCQSYGKHVLVHASTIKKTFATHRGTHKLNKVAAVECAKRLNPALFASMCGKLDDLADAFLLAWYAHAHLSHAYRGKIPKAPIDHYEQPTAGTCCHCTRRDATLGTGEDTANGSSEGRAGGDDLWVDGEERGRTETVRGEQCPPIVDVRC